MLCARQSDIMEMYNRIPQNCINMKIASHSALFTGS